MRAIIIDRWTRPEELRVGEVARPACGPHELRIAVHAAAVSYALSLLIQGRYQRKPAFPFVPGNTVAGEVVEVGSAARRFRVGDRVLASMELGALAEQAVTTEANCYAIPPNLGFAEATALNTSYNSVYAALVWPHLLAVQPGQSLLVHGAAGGVGTAACEIGRLRGATIIACASTEAKRAWALKHGAHHAIGADVALLRDRVRALTTGEGVDAVLDPVGGALFSESLRCLKPEGRILPIGFASGEIPQIPANILLVKNITVCGLYMGYYKIDQRDRYEAQMRELFGTLGRWCEEGLIRPAVTARFPLERTPEAFAAVLDRNHIGHVVVTMER
ncbi:MAG: NADPH:quinone oxidoreductase family protein [Alphaproteobacteria bacterium]|nr:NADPH:quinone oxidoreductase family protein [Alphaproteobacteria bacterium]